MASGAAVPPEASGMWWVWTATDAHAIECAERVSQAELAGRLDSAEKAFADLDDAAFRDDVNEIAGLVLPCMGDLVPPDLAARYHRIMALHLEALGDTTDAGLAVAASRRIEPDYKFDDAVFPADQPVRVAWEAADPTPVTHKVPEPRSGSLAFDGHNGRERPTGVPSLVQVFDDDGTAISTSWLGPRDPLPTYRAIPRTRDALVVCSATGLVGGGVSLGFAWAERAALLGLAADPGAPAADLDARRGAMNLLSLVGTGLVGVGLGCGTGAALVGER
jgi:hypothetical protein